MSDEVAGAAPNETVISAYEMAKTQAGRERERDIAVFEAWQRGVAGHIARFTDGLTPDDLPDYDYDLAYSQDRNPRTVARQAIRAAGGF